MKRIAAYLGAASMFSLSIAASAQQKDFSIAIIPDTQYYTEESKGGKNSYFVAQTEWIAANREKENIAYVIHVGDVVDKGDSKPGQWVNAKNAMYLLEKPLPGMPYGIPYGVAVGNHDQSPSQFGLTGNTYHFNKYFGIEHFKGRPYYGGHFGNDNDSHYDLFSAGGMDFVVIYIEYDAYDEAQDAMNEWAAGLLDKYASRKAIVVSHYIIGNNKVAGTNAKGEATFGKQGRRIYDRLKTKPNLFMMVCGHVGANGEGYRQDTYAGRTVKTFLADYQSRENGGNGLMRLVHVSPEKDQLNVRTFSPAVGTVETDDDSEFTKPLFREPAASRVLDFDNDGKTDVVTFEKGKWQIGTGIIDFGKDGDIPVPAHFAGRGQTDVAVYSPETSTFKLKDGRETQFGEAGDIPLVYDYTGDGMADLAVFRPSNATWYVEGKEPVKHGWKNSIPVPADFDGDGKAELAVYQTDNQYWYVADMGNFPQGQAGDIPLPADYTGDGRADFCLYRPSTSEWLIRNKEPLVLGKKGDIPVPGDYDGSGKVVPAVYSIEQKAIITAGGKKISVEKSGTALVNLPDHLKRFFFKAL